MPDSLCYALEDINGIQFTPKQIDVLACIISGRNTKAIASLLNIAIGTVEKHTEKLREKAGVNSKERLIPFVEASGKFSLVKQHYLNILIENEFHKKLQDIKKLVAVENTRCLISYGEPQDQFKPFAKRLVDYLEIIGITTREKLLKQQYKEQSIDKSSAYIHISLPTKVESEIHAEDNTLSSTTLAPSIQQEEYAYLIVVQPANLSEADSNAANLQPIIYAKNSLLSITFLDVLSQLFPEKADTHQQIKADFKTYIDRLQSNKIPLEYTKKHQKNQSFTLVGLQQILKKYGALRSISFALILTLLCFCGVRGLDTKAPKEIARVTISLPPGMLLERSSILTEMNKKLSAEDQICSLALIGIGGCGKTTLAKQFATCQNFSIVGEINAASHDKLLTSFENFAHDLSITDADKKALNEIKELTGNEQKEKRLINFVKERMRYHEKWLIIFDNVEKFSEIQKYYPTSIKEWGRGAVIILTQSDHLKQSPAINHKILISELSSVEKKELFLSIMSAKQPSSLTPVPRTRIEKFLKEIPPFPLDVSLAAHYIMSMNISPDEYLERIQAQNHNFISTQHAIFGAHYDYAKSRFSIITLPLQKIIDDNDSFIEALFYLCMVDPEGIPRYILDKRLGKELADQLIHSLKQCSLISDQKTPSAFRMHRSTQDILTKYLKAKLDAKKIEEFSHPLIAMMEEYTCKIIENEDHQQAKFFLPHLESLAKNNQIFLLPIQDIIDYLRGIIYASEGYYREAIKTLKKLNVLSVETQVWNTFRKAKIFRALGIAYLNVGNYPEAQLFLEKSLRISQKDLPQDYQGRPMTLIYLGNVHRGLGQYEEAKKYLEEALFLHQQSVSHNKVIMTRALKYLGMVYRNLGEYDNAQRMLKQSIDYYQQLDNPVIAGSLVYLGDIQRDLGNYQEATKHIEEGLKIYRSYYTAEHTHIAWALGHLGRAYRDSGQYSKALILFAEAENIYRKAGSINGRAWILTHCGSTYHAIGEFQKAKELLDESKELYKHCSSDKLGMAETLGYLATVYRDCDEYRLAEELFIECLKLYEDISPRPSTFIAWAQFRLGQLYKRTGKLDQAFSLINKSQDIYLKHYGSSHIEVARSQRELGHIHFLKGEYDAAENLLKQAITSAGSFADFYFGLKLLFKIKISRIINLVLSEI